MSYRLLKLKKPRLFKPSYQRGEKSLAMSTNPNNISIGGAAGNSENTSSFRYESNKSLKSTQQLNIDYSYFENHTFFDSALSKTNIAFDKIINKYPFEGSLQEVEEFEDNLSGFENYVLDNYPKHTGSLVLSGTAINEDPLNGYAVGLGQYIVVKDGKGLQFPNFSKNSTAIADLDPGDDSFTFEFFINLPKQSNLNQVICQKRSSISSNITVALESSSDINSAGLKFGVTNGTEFLFLSSSIEKGSFKHISLQFDNKTDLSEQQNLKYYLDGELVLTSSTQFQLGSISLNKADFIIGSGSQARINEQLFTPQQTFSGSIDEFRFFHSARKQDTLKSQMFQNIYAASDLKIYYKFNETGEIHSLNSAVLDSSGNSRHSKISNYNTACRSTVSPVKAENLKRNPVLFFVQTVANLNTRLVNSASFYDEFNPNLITKLVPPHLFLDGEYFEGLDQNNPLAGFEKTPTQSNMPGSGKFGSAQLLISFLLIWAKFFDELKLFVDSFGDVRDINYNTGDTTPDVFLKALASHYNIELPDFFPNADLDQLVSGEGIYSVGSQRSKHTLEYIQNQLWRRILTNAVYLQKSTGTIEGMRSALRSMGVNVDDIFTIREYGGQSRVTLDGIRVDKTDNIRQLSFTGSLAEVTPTLSFQGVPDNLPYLKSGFLSSSRLEIGRPQIQGTFVNKDLFFPHGISNKSDDGILTSGSFTYEGVYRFPYLKSGSYPQYQSLVRLHVTGTDAPSNKQGVLTNLVLTSGSSPTFTLYAHPGQTATAATDQLINFDIGMPSGSIFDGNFWHVSFGRKRGDLIFDDEPTDSFNKTSISSSYFLRIAQVGDKRLHNVYTGSTVRAEDNGVVLKYYKNAFQSGSTTHNSSGSFVTIGSQSLEPHRFYFLNKTALSNVVRTTDFAGELSQARFWSKAVSDREFREHARNLKSLGSEDPRFNYNFMTHNTGTFEQVRLWTAAKQGTTSSNASGDIRLFDFSQNNLHLMGTGFEPNKVVFNTNQLRYSTLNPQFDVAGTTDKVRIRSLKKIDPIKNLGYPYASSAPVYNVPENEEVIDDLRFSLEMSLVKALNEDIVNMFSDYQFMENALGRTNLLFSEKYPELDQVRKNYFENTTGKLDVDKYYKLFKWFNDTFSSTIEQMLPSKTKFMGINFVIESHALERHKFKYYYDEIYLKALQRDPSRGVILLSQFVGTLKKF